MRLANKNELLYLVIGRFLSQSFFTTVDKIVVQLSITVDEKIKHLETRELPINVPSKLVHASHHLNLDENKL